MLPLWQPTDRPGHISGALTEEPHCLVPADQVASAPATVGVLNSTLPDFMPGESRLVLLLEELGGFTFLTLVLSAELWACRDGGRE